jgi:uncharacterized repeat protein (TIGR01451 family)
MTRFYLHPRYLLLALTFVLAVSEGFTQDNREVRAKALSYLQQHYFDLELTQQDVADTRITDSYLSKNNGVTHVWIQQQFQGIPVFNGLIGLHVAPDAKVYHVGHRFVQDIQRKANTTLPALNASKALELALANLGLQGHAAPSLRQKINERNWVFEAGTMTKQEIPVSACFVKQPGGALRLAWTMSIEPVNSIDIWNIRVDALTGLILDKFNQTLYCTWDNPGTAGSTCQDMPAAAPVQRETPGNQSNLLTDEQYHVFALPIESPIFGSRSIVTNPHDILASPYGWLDDNGMPGAEYTYTRGNNAWAFDDSANDNMPTQQESADAGASLLFDFPFDMNAEPGANKQAAITNLFYMTNKMHDIMYRYGFDEAAGNYQSNNYGRPGEEGDAVSAQALDGSGVNNANFSITADGNSGRMQMYVWNTTGGSIVQVNAPGVVSGVYFGGQGGWGGAITTTPLTAEVVFVNDGVEPTLGCEPPANNVTGKIVMIDRGDCQFSEKALFVQEAGAVACIICDHESPPQVGFDGGDYGSQINIPALYMKKADCSLLRQHAGAGLNISLVQPSTGGGPNEVDGAFDNGIMAHEYAHGVSSRLTGGSSSPWCLGHPEQMGEGWSDFFFLATTVNPGDTGAKKRGFSNYVYRKPQDGNGVRRYPYSTDLSINPLTFSAVSENPEIHALGEIWAAMTWDLYWALVEKYGYDADINNMNSGNARAIQLVMDGLKMQPCEPGFEDARNAIMLADKMNYNGADTCLISSVFARRGLGYYASQVDQYVATDGIENFDPIPVCVKELKIKKISTTPLIKPGENAEFVLTITNHKGVDAPNVVVTDELPAGLTLVSASNGGFLSGNMVVWNLGTMPNGQVITLTYTARSNGNNGSVRYFHDLMETSDNWYSLSINQTNIELFELQNTDVIAGSFAWRANESATEKTDFVLGSDQIIPITGSNPVLRFWHQYNTEPSADAGFLEFQDVDAPNPMWRRVTNEETFRNGYDNKVSYGTFALPNHYGFSGDSEGWVQSYFDMREFSGKNMTFRFRFGTDNNTAAPGGKWLIDEVEILDMLHFDTEACVSSGGDQACDRADARGVIVDPATVATNEAAAATIQMTVQPNPASDMVYVSFPQSIVGVAQLSLRSVDGRVVRSKTMPELAAGAVITLDVQNLSAGLYLLELESSGYNSAAKVVLR